ncbi:MAG TPA: hypothetical protein VK738_03960 [Terriglobales bacterium]|jgi:hypothetical protein|nr:hypothetical protein [Terriglobales bacterium]
MAFSHLEQLISEYLDWKGFLVKRNVKVGRRVQGGWEMELDIVGYNPLLNKLVHYEPSTDGDSWEKRTVRYEKKFKAGRKYIREEIFKWIPVDCNLEQFAVFIVHPKNREEIAGGKILSLDEFMREVKDEVAKEGIIAKKAISEVYPLLRTLQLALNGYYKVL